MSHTKRIDAELNRRFGARLKAWVADKHGGNQSAAGRELGCSQSHISALIAGERGVGLQFLLIFAGATDLSLDELLGMRRGTEEEERIRRLLREELAAIRSATEVREIPHAKPLRRRRG